MEAPAGSPLKRKREEEEEEEPHQGKETTDLEPATTLLRETLGPKATFRKEQRETLSLILGKEPKQHVLYITRTGGGKSAAYFIASRLLRKRDQNAGPTIVVCPLNSLANDQVEAAKRYGCEARAFNSSQDQVMQGTILEELLFTNKIDLLYVTPEMLTGKRFPQQVPQFAGNYRENPRHKWTRFPLLVIDEAHCVSEWGHGYRPSYHHGLQDLMRKNWFNSTPKIATSATINHRSEKDLQFLAGDVGWTVVRGPLLRKNLAIRVVVAANQQAKEGWLVDSFRAVWGDKNVLIFCNFKHTTEDYSRVLNKAGIRADYYHAGRPSSDRKQLEAAFRDGRLRVLVATEALGMGFDKSDIHVVVHMESPSSPIRYYQEIGRAGRDPSIQARAYLVPSRPFNTDRSCSTAWRRVYRLLQERPSSRKDIEDFLQANDVKKRIGKEAVENAMKKKYLVQQGALFSLSPTARETEPGQDDFIADREAEMEWMLNFPGLHDQCLWAALLKHLQDPHVSDEWSCDKCSSCLTEDDEDIPADATANRETCYRAKTPNGLLVYALGLKEEEVYLTPGKIRAIMAQYVRGLAIDPPNWMLSYVPSTGIDPNRENWQNLCKALTLRGFEYITSDPQAGKVRNAHNPHTRKLVLDTKFTFNVRDKPSCGGIVIYDNMLCSGDTLDKVAAPLLAFGIEVVGFVNKLFPYKETEWEPLELTPY